MAGFIIFKLPEVARNAADKAESKLLPLDNISTIYCYDEYVIITDKQDWKYIIGCKPDDVLKAVDYLVDGWGTFDVVTSSWKEEYIGYAG